jgi:hypothetical protein
MTEKQGYPSRLIVMRVDPFRFTVRRAISFHFVHVFNAKDLRQIGWVCEMK